MSARRGLGLWLLSALSGFGTTGSALAEDGLSIERWLDRPGVRMVVVEFYATWCKPCMDAVPQWKALHEKYYAEGLRFIVVSTRDAKGACASPGWTPDEVVCDLDGRVADLFGATSLPSAYVWDWQGHLLAEQAHVGSVSEDIDDWMAQMPRVEVQAETSPSSDVRAAALRRSVRADLKRRDQLVVVASERERAELRKMVRKSLEYHKSPKTGCEVGQEISANSLLKAFLTDHEAPRLQLELFSAERGCLVAASATRWSPQKPEVSIGEAVSELLGQLRLNPIQSPWGRSRPSGPTAAPLDPGALSSASVPEAPPEEGPVAETRAERPRRPFDGKTPGWVTAVGATGTIIAAGTLFYLSEQHREDADSAVTTDDFQDNFESYRDMRAASIVLGGVGAGLGVLSAIFFGLHQDAPQPVTSILEDGEGGWVGIRGAW